MTNTLISDSCPLRMRRFHTVMSPAPTICFAMDRWHCGRSVNSARNWRNRSCSRGLSADLASRPIAFRRKQALKPGSLGRIVEGYEAKIVDADGKEVATGEMGTLKIKGDSAALCYWNAHEKSKETFAGDWCTSGDQFHVDQDGYYWCHGRTDDMLKVSGIYVAPAEIENCLLQHEAVLECAVVGHESDGLVKPKAFVVLREGFESGDMLADEIKQFVKNKIAGYKYPRWIEFVDGLPKTATGKIQRFMLRDRVLRSNGRHQ